jgi:hypothetical protein
VNARQGVVPFTLKTRRDFAPVLAAFDLLSSKLDL